MQMEPRVEIDATGCKTVTDYVTLLGPHIGEIVDYMKVRIMPGSEYQWKCALAIQGLLASKNASQYSERFQIESESADGCVVTRADHVEIKGILKWKDGNKLLMDITKLREDGELGQYYAFVRSVNWITSNGTVTCEVRINLPAGSDVNKYVKHIVCKYKNANYAPYLCNVLILVEGVHVSNAALLDVGYVDTATVVIDATREAPTIDNYVQCILRAEIGRSRAKIMLAADGNVQKCMIALANMRDRYTGPLTNDWAEIVCGNRTYTLDPDIYKSYGIYRTETTDVVSIDITRLADDTTFVQIDTYVKCLRMLLSRGQISTVMVYVPDDGHCCVEMYARVTCTQCENAKYPTSFLDRVFIYGCGGDGRSARAIDDALMAAPAPPYVSRAPVITKIGSTDNPEIAELVASDPAMFAPEAGDDWDIGDISTCTPEGNTVFYGVGDTPEGFKADIYTMVNMLARQRAASDSTDDICPSLWIHLWDETRLREYKGFISGILKNACADIARLRAAITFYKLPSRA